MIWSPWLWQRASYLSEFASWALKLIVSQFSFFLSYCWLDKKEARCQATFFTLFQSSIMTDTLNLFPQLLHIMSFTHLLLISWSPFSQLCGRESAKCLQIYRKQNRSNLIIPFSRASPKTSAIWGTMAERNKLRNKKKCHVMKKLRGSCDLIVFFSITHAKPLKARCWPGHGTVQHVPRLTTTTLIVSAGGGPLDISQIITNTSGKFQQKYLQNVIKAICIKRMYFFGLVDWVMGRLSDYVIDSKLLPENHLFNWQSSALSVANVKSISSDCSSEV